MIDDGGRTLMPGLINCAASLQIEWIHGARPDGIGDWSHFDLKEL